jgi:hypothetical protein
MHYHQMYEKPTLDIDDDVLFSAKELAAKERKKAGKVLSEFFRRGIQTGNTAPDRPKLGQPYAMKNGIAVLPSRDEVVTTEHIRSIMEEEGI